MHAQDRGGYRGMSPPPAQQQPGIGQAVGYGYANHRPGGLQNQHSGYSSAYQDSQADFYPQQGGGGYNDHHAPQQQGQYAGGRPEYGNRQYSEQTLPAYQENDHFMQQPRHEDYQHDRRSPQPNYNQGGGYQHQDQNQGAGYRAFSPAYGGGPNRAANGSWKDL